MKKLKENLSEYASEAFKGNTIEVLRYNKPFIKLSPVRELNIHIGKKAGKARLSSKYKSKGNYSLKILLLDREE